MKKKRKIALKGGIVAVLLAVIAACGSPTDQEYLDNALELLANGDTTAAIIELQNAVKSNPNNPRARLLLGQTALDNGLMESAEKELRRAQELGASSSEVQPQLARALFLAGKYRDVVGEFGFLDESLDDQAVDTVQGIVGRSYVILGEYDKARLILDGVLERSPDLPDALLGKAALLALRGDFDQAGTISRRILELYPTSVEGWSYAGSIAEMEGKPEEALAAFDRAIELSNYPRIDYSRRGQVKLKLGDTEGALEDALFNIENRYENSALANFVAGVAYTRQGNYPEAETYLNKAKELAPNNLEAKILLASAYIAQGKDEQARVLSEQIYATAPDYPVSARLIGAVYAGEKRYSEATAILSRALSEHPDNVEILRMLGILSLNDGTPAEALDYFDRVLSLDADAKGVKEARLLAKFAAGQPIDDEIEQADIDTPDGFRVYMLYGASLMAQGKSDEALPVLQQLQKAQPSNPEPLNLMASYYVAKQDWGNAREYLEKVLELKPAHTSAAHTLAHLELLYGDPAATKAILTEYLAIPGAVPLPKTYLLLSDVELKAGDNEAVGQALTTGLERFPDDPGLTLALGRNLFREKKFAEAADLLKEVSEEQGQAEPRLWELQGKIAVLAGNNPAAERAFKQWLDAEPENPAAVNFYADSLFRNNRSEEALEYFARAISLDENYLNPRIGQANALILSGDVDGARESLAKTTERFAITPDIQWLQGRLAILEGDFAGAEVLLAQADEEVDSTQLTLDLARAQWQQEKRDVAVQTLENRIAKWPADIDTRIELAASYLALGDRKQAIKAYQDILGISPDQPLALNNLAGLLAETDAQQALEYAEKAYLVAPANPYIQDTLGMLLIRSGSEEGLRRGLELTRSATRAEPQSAEFGLHFAEAMIKSGQNAEAKAELERVLALEPEPGIASRTKALLKTL